jgi:hypothetical protein
MKKIILYSWIILLISCNKDVPERSVIQYEPTSLDELAGSWKTIHLGAATDLQLPAPDASSSSSYKQEIDAIVQKQRSLTPADQQLIQTWKGSGVIRWNEVARALVATYNLPPEANPDGTYPVPSAANPGAYPKFPFANPPYASRAYAYLHTAIYDVLVVVWAEKFRHKRMSPATNSTQVKALEPFQPGLPSYPSEDAAVAQVAVRLLSVLFPNDTVMLQTMSAGQKQAKWLSGQASESDIRMGERIGNAVADRALQRLRSDNMGAAVGNPAVWAAMEQGAVARGNVLPWKSMETPARPMMLANFGNVRLWSMNAAQRDSLRPGPPPPVGSPLFLKELEEVKRIDRSRNSKEWQIALYWSDGVGTYTPPGHWNEIATNTIAREGLSEVRAARVYCHLNMAMADAAICCWDTKMFYFSARPSQVDPSIKTIGLPNFPGYTSGHSTFSGAAATILGVEFPSEKQRFEEMAAEASVSRIYGGIHFRSDCEVGLRCGQAIAQMVLKFVY